MKIAAIFITIGSLLIGNVLASPPGCPCSPCTCSPCHCGGGHHEHARFGVGASVDLGGVGHRQREADPFAVPSESSSTASRSEAKKTKKPAKESSSGNAFANVKLTGPDAKDIKLADAAKGVSKP
jgi:hypothetical protein